MKQNTNSQSIERALHSFRIAENEFNRPHEDTVTLCTCYYTRNSIDEFLRAFLFEKSAVTDFTLKSEQLLNECLKLDSQFRKIDLSCFACNCAEEAREQHYCLAAEKVKECFQTAQAVKELVMSGLNIAESDFEK